MSNAIMKSTKHMIGKNKAEGFSLLEVLIAIIILSIGMLGLAALQAASLKTNHGAYHKTQATFFAYDMADRLRANRAVAMAGTYNIALATDTPAANGNLPNDDINDWLTNVNGTLPSGDGAITCDNTGLCTIMVTWDVQREGGTALDSNINLQQFNFTTSI